MAQFSAEMNEEIQAHCRLPGAVLGAPPNSITHLAHNGKASTMADEGNVISNLDLGPQPNGEDTLPSAGIISQYVKDLSVENPNAPESFQWQDQPQLDVQFNIGAREVGDDVHEVELKIVLNAKSEAGTAYIVDLAYCGLVGMRNLDEGQMHAFTFAEAPRILFPFARRVVADAVRDAGYPPLMLEPLDFNGLYMQQMQAQQDAAETAPAGNA
jgi:preprotein translocase subunit SecB